MVKVGLKSNNSVVWGGLKVHSILLCGMDRVRSSVWLPSLVRAHPLCSFGYLKVYFLYHQTIIMNTFIFLPLSDTHILLRTDDLVPCSIPIILKNYIILALSYFSVSVTCHSKPKWLGLSRIIVNLLYGKYNFPC